MSNPHPEQQVTDAPDAVSAPASEALQSDQGRRGRPPSVVDTLRIRNFRLFFIGAFVSNLGTWLQSVPLAWLILELTDSAFWVAMVPVMTFGPMLVLGLPGGAVADRFERKRVLLISQTVMMIAAVGLATITYRGWATVSTVFPLVLVTGCALAFNAPAFQAFIADLVPRHHVPTAVSLNSFQFSLGRVLGPAIGGYILATSGVTEGGMIEASGPGLAFAINAATFLAVIAMLLLIKAPAHERSSGFTGSSFLGGFRAVRESPVIGTLIGVAMCFSLLSAPTISLLPVYARHVLGKGAGAYGSLFAAFALGTAFGSVFTPKILRSFGYRRLVITATTSQALILTGFSLSRNFVLSLALVTFFGSMHGSILAGTSSALQLTTPARRRGRVMSLFLMAFAGLYPLGALIGGTFAEAVGVPRVLMVAAGLLGLSAIAWWRFGTRLKEVEHT